MRSAESLKPAAAAALIETCAARAEALLRANLGPLGFLAGSPGHGARRRDYKVNTPAPPGNGNTFPWPGILCAPGRL